MLPRLNPGRIASAGLLGLLVTSLSGCGQVNEYQAPPPPTVTVSQPIQKTVVNFLEETGTTEAVALVDIRARVRGYLEQVEFEPGVDVEEGQRLYVIEQRPYRNSVDVAQADLDAKRVELERADIELKRNQKLFKENAASERALVTAEADFKAAQAVVDAAQATLDQAKLDLEYTEVRSPIAGRVGKTLVKEGNLVGEEDATHLTTVTTYDPIYANFNISERQLLEIMSRAPREERDRVDIGKIPVFLQRANDDDFRFEGRMNYADLAVDQSTGTFMVRGLFPNPDRTIIPGLFVTVRLPIGVQENALLVPERAVASDQAGRFVLIVNSENVVERRNVVVGAKHGELVVIEQGLVADDWVVTDGIQRSRPGVKVDPSQTELTDSGGDIEIVQPGESPPPEEGAAQDPATDGDAATDVTPDDSDGEPTEETSDDGAP